MSKRSLLQITKAKLIFIFKIKVQFLHLDPDPATRIRADPIRIRNPALAQVVSKVFGQ